MQPAWGVGIVGDEVLRVSAQYGIENIVLYSGPGSVSLPGTGQPLGKRRADYRDYLAIRRRIESFGLRIAAVEGGFAQLAAFHDVVFGGPDRDRLIEELIDEIRDMARAGIPIYGYHWMPNSVWRTDPVTIRGGAFGTAFDYDLVRDGPRTHSADCDETELWRNLEYWIRAVTPVAEEEGIRLGIHPDDPPVAESGGVPRLLRTFDAYKRLVDIYPSDSNAIEFCQGTFSEMNEDIYEMIRYFAERRKILYVHFRNVSAQVPRFNEEFINTGYVDMYRAMTTYRDAGYDGVFMDDHCPFLDDDVHFPGNVGGYRSRLFAQGYIQGMLEVTTARQAGMQEGS